MSKVVSSLSLLLLLICLTSLKISAQGRSTISGIVFDNNRKPVSDLYVELQNEVFSMIGRTKTNGGGQFFFGNLSRGNYKVKVLTAGTNFVEQTQDVVVTTIRRGNLETPDYVQIDFYLKPDSRNSGPTTRSEAIFIQEIPDNAKDLYEKGVKQLSSKNDAGLATIKSALDIFPTYFDALNSLGIEYAQRQKYQEALPYLIKAIDINQRSFSSFYTLGIVCYKLNHIPESIEAFRGATIINPQSASSHLYYGTVLRMNGQYEVSEKELLQAEKLSKEKPIPEIYWELALVYNKTKRNKEAVTALETFLKLQPDNPEKQKIRKLIETLKNSN